MSSARTYYPTPYPSGMSEDDIRYAEDLNAHAFIFNVPKSRHFIPSWSSYYSGEQPSEDEDDYIPPPSKKKVKQPVQTQSSNRFAILAKLPDNATTLTKTPKRK